MNNPNKQKKADIGWGHVLTQDGHVLDSDNRNARTLLDIGGGLGVAPAYDTQWHSRNIDKRRKLIAPTGAYIEVDIEVQTQADDEVYVYVLPYDEDELTLLGHQTVVGQVPISVTHTIRKKGQRQDVLYFCARSVYPTLQLWACKCLDDGGSEVFETDLAEYQNWDAYDTLTDKTEPEPDLREWFLEQIQGAAWTSPLFLDVHIRWPGVGTFSYVWTQEGSAHSAFWAIFRLTGTTIINKFREEGAL